MTGGKRFPIQEVGDVPWVLAEQAYATYARLFGTDQSLVRLAERGGFGLQEFACLLAGHKPDVGWNAEHHHQCVVRAVRLVVAAAEARGPHPRERDAFMAGFTAGKHYLHPPCGPSDQTYGGRDEAFALYVKERSQ